MDSLLFLAAAPAAGGSAFFVQIVPLLLIFVVFYFFLIRPQQKRQKEHQKMCEALTKGDEIVTIGGLAGRIAEVSEQYVVIEISRVEGNPVTITMQRGAVQTVLPRGTLKSIDTNGDGKVDTDGLRYVPGESESSYVTRITNTLRSTIRDSTTH